MTLDEQFLRFSIWLNSANTICSMFTFTDLWFTESDIGIYVYFPSRNDSIFAMRK